jgi:hypothetical protein
MNRFDLRTIFYSMAFLAAGFAVARQAARSSSYPPNSTTIVLLLCAGGLIGSGMLMLAKRPIFGAVIGVLLQLVVILLIALFRIRF